mgnify:CR=1 FL=1
MKTWLKLAAMAVAGPLLTALLVGAMIALMFWGCTKTLKFLP